MSAMVGDAAMRLAQVDLGPVDLQAQLLQATWDLDAPALVAEVPADLADDGRRRVAGELAAARRVITVHGVDQADHRDLGQVVDGLSPVAEAPGQTSGEGDVVLDRLGAELRPLGRVLGQKSGGGRAGRAP